VHTVGTVGKGCNIYAALFPRILLSDSPHDRGDSGLLDGDNIVRLDLTKEPNLSLGFRKERAL
jgi:hypothetical protein